ncbi:MAG: hypothetical protein LBT83_10300 [Tannerella sp.]|jgi:hypothetical protein|nr:hypothetical protein [Tannerella sp.]
MAKQKGNVVTHGLRGKIGDLLLFRQYASGTVVSSIPRASGKESELQKAQRRKFQHAVLYAKAISADPELNAAYAEKAKSKPGLSARNVAIADFMHAPDIERIDLSGYHGRAGDVIRIEVTDDFAVKEVKVVISKADGILVEEGNAQPDVLKCEWTYRATQTNDDLTGLRIEIFASDMPGNISTAMEEL